MSDNSVFGYQDPPGDKQCGSCFMWSSDDRCIIHGRRTVTKDMSCIYYVLGKNRSAGMPPVADLQPEETGLVERQVRCENCRWFDGRCGLFIRLNRTGLFRLDPKVDAKGCCNAQEPPDKKKQAKEPSVLGLLAMISPEG